MKNTDFKPLSRESLEILGYLPGNIVIAHRGTTYWAPEETEMAMRWGRDIGADYLEMDIQRTKDGILIALHDEDLRRTTNVTAIYPERANKPVSEFTLAELRSLDTGKWFNQSNPEQARKEFEGQDILTLEDVVRIAEGYRIVRGPDGKRLYSSQDKLQSVYEPDPADSGNRPGIYPETKEPHLFPGVETDLRKELERLGWYHPEMSRMKEIPVKPDCVAIANSPARVILQTFSDQSLVRLKEAFPRLIPTCFLLWLGTDEPDLKEDSLTAYLKKINFGIEHGAVIIGPSIAGAPNNYPDLLQPWQGKLIHTAGLAIHPYSFDTEEQMAKYTGLNECDSSMNRTDGMFTNRSDLAILFYQKKLQENHLNSSTPTGGPSDLQSIKKHPDPQKVLDKLSRK